MKHHSDYSYKDRTILGMMHNLNGFIFLFNLAQSLELKKSWYLGLGLGLEDQTQTQTQKTQKTQDSYPNPDPKKTKNPRLRPKPRPKYQNFWVLKN